jgi:hypothetical protein
MTFFLVKTNTPRDSTQWIGPFVAKWDAHQYLEDHKLRETHEVVARDEL